MKQFLKLAAFLCLGLSSCQKEPQFPNSISITNSGYHFNESSGPVVESASVNTISPEGVTVALYKGIPGNDSAYGLSIVVSTGSAYALSFRNAFSANSGGLYTLRQEDSAGNIFTEFGPNGGETYKISGGTVNITSATAANVSGTFSLQVYNNSGTSTITGSLCAHKPTFYY